MTPLPRWETPEPPKWAGTYGKAIAAHAKRVFNIQLDPWQRHVIDRTMLHDVKGVPIVRQALWSVARQNGKSVGVRSIVNWLLDEGYEVPAFAAWRELLAAAHDAPQARLTYRGVLTDLSGVARIKESHRLTQYVGIEAPNGLRFDTVTSQPGSVRGHAAGMVAWDEVLTQRDHSMLEVLLPVTSAQPNPLMLYTSTAGFSDSVVLKQLYDETVAQATGSRKPDRAFYGAWYASEDPDAQLDWDQIKRANPSLGLGRLSREAIRTEYRILPPSSWRRERLNHWVDDAVADAAFNPTAWKALRSPAPLDGLDGPFYLGVDVHPGWERASVTVACVRPDGRVGVEVWRDLRAEDQPITAAVILEAVKAFPKTVSAVVYEAVIGPAGELTRQGEADWGVEWRALKPNQVVAACIDTMEMVQSGRLAVDDPLLDAQVPMVAKRPVGQDGAYRWSRAHSLGPIDAVNGMTWAAAAAVNAGAMPSMV